MTMNIAIIYSPNWAEWAAVETYSIFKNHKDIPVKVYLVTDKDGFFDASKIEKKINDEHLIEFIDAGPLYSQLKTNNKNVTARFTMYTLYRLILPQLINEDKLLYLDADAVVNGNIEDFYNTDMTNYYVAGCEDIGADSYNLKAPLGIRKNEPYINAGVILMNLKKIKEDKIDSKWIYEMNANAYLANDQCIVNKTCKGKIKTVGNEYNTSISTGLNIERDKIKIMHWAGAKPWNDNTVPHARIWFDHVRDFKKSVN